MKMDLDSLDEIVERILDIVNEETEWKNKTLIQDKVVIADESVVLNIEGTLRERLKTLLDTVKKDETQSRQVIKMDESAKRLFMKTYGKKLD